MTFPKLGGAGNSLHLNHSLWTLDGHNAMKDEEASISTLAQHWNAGLLSHAAALTAFCCPTVNCFRRLHLGDSYPSHITWSVENRNSLNRFKVCICCQFQVPWCDGWVDVLGDGSFSARSNQPENYLLVFSPASVSHLLSDTFSSYSDFVLLHTWPAMVGTSQSSVCL